MDRFVAISGCSGGGKSSLIAELQRRGHSVIEEAGRRIVRQETASGGRALPWLDLAAFARRTIALALEDRERAAALPGIVFFDRSVVDVAAALEHAGGESVLQPLGRGHRYAATVFMAPPWPELFQGDEERRHGFEDARSEYDRLCAAYSALGYELAALPKLSIARRADWLERQLATNPPCRDWP